MAKTICQACRGYDLERQWCDRCKGTGYEEAAQQQAEPTTDKFRLVPVDPDCYTLSLIPGHTAESAKKLYQHIVESASAHASNSPVKAWSCNSETNGSGLCKSWCRDPIICPASMGDWQQAEPAGDERACERCGQPSSEHVGTHWCDNQSFQVEQSSSLSVHVDSLDGQLEYLIGRVKTVPSDDMADLVVANIRDRIGQIRSIAAQSCQRAGVAKGWVLVPIEPTPHMAHCGGRVAASGNTINGYGKHVLTEYGAQEVWRAMLAAAPTPAAQGGDSHD